MKKYVFSVFAALAILSIAVLAVMHVPEETREAEEKQWIEIEPVQCMDNPWEIAWVQKHGEEKLAEYPEKGSSEETQVIKDYYAGKGITVHDVKSVQEYDMVCMACDCPRGDVLSLLVSENDVYKMLEFGYRLAE